MSIRVISGSAKGRKLKLVPGDTTRPIMDRVKENLFNILGDWVLESRWLDLFAGTGSVGIEALSRGASYCMFVDMSQAAISTVKENLTLTRLAEHAVIRRADAIKMLQTKPTDAERVEAIFVAPPQYKSIWANALRTIDGNISWLLDEGVVVVQIDPREFSEVALKNLTLFDQRTYGNSMLCFYETTRS